MLWTACCCCWWWLEAVADVAGLADEVDVVGVVQGFGDDTQMMDDCW